MKGVGLRRQQRQASGQSAAPSNDAPVPVVFRVHSDALSKAQFLFCPKNFNLANPSTAPSTPASASSPTTAGTSVDGDGPRDAIETLVEAFVELRPFFPTRSSGPAVGSAGAMGQPGVGQSFGSTASFSSLLREATPGSPLSFASPTATGEPNAGQPQRGLYRHPHRLLNSYSSVQDLVHAATAAQQRTDGSRAAELASPVLYTSISEANLNNSLQLALGGATSGSFAGGGPSSNALVTNSFVDLCALSTYVSSTAVRLENDRYSGDHHHHHAVSSNAGGGGVGGGGGGLGKRGDGAGAGPGGRSLGGTGSGGSSSLRSSARGVGGGPAGSAAGGGGGVGAGSGGAGGAMDFASDGHAGAAPLLMHPCGSWICRAMAFNERETVHANGAISVNQSLTLKCPIVNEIAKGKTMAKLVSYEEVRERFGLSHVELSFEHQYVSRSDMFLISEALRERVLYEGEELSMCGFRFKANELLQTFHAVAVSPATPTTTHSQGSAEASGVNRAAGSRLATGSAAIPLPSSPNSVLPTRDSNPDVHGGSGGHNTNGNISGGGTTHSGARRGRRSSGLTRSGSKEDAASVAGGPTNPNPNTATAAATDNTEIPERQEIRVGCGLVTANTRINFRSLSPVHYIVVELTHEMWATTLDGRICLTWALKKFMRELLLQQLPRRRASPLLRVIFTGRLRREFMFSGESDLFHMLEIPQDTRGIDVAEEVERHCEVLVERIVREVREEALRRLVLDDAGGAWEAFLPPPSGSPCTPSQPRAHAASLSSSTATDSVGGAAMTTTTATTTATVTPAPDPAFVEAARQALEARIAAIQRLTPKDVFVHAKQSNTLEALSIILEQCTHHYVDRRLHSTGHCVTVVTAGKGHYHTSNGLVQINCTRMHDLGLERVHFVCIGRPPLHATPLLEYTTEDETLRAQYHLPYGGGPRDGHQYYFEVPEWAICFFYYPVLGTTSGETRFELLTKRDWQQRYTTATALSIPVVERSPASGPSTERLSGSLRTPAAGAQTGTSPTNNTTTTMTVQSRLGGREAQNGTHTHHLSPPTSHGAGPSSVVVGVVVAPGCGTASEALSTVPAALINGQRVLLQGLGLSMCPAPTVVLPTHYVHSAAGTRSATGNTLGGGGAGHVADHTDADVLAPNRYMDGLGPGCGSTSSLLPLHRDFSSGYGLERLAGLASPPLPTAPVQTTRAGVAGAEDTSQGSAPRPFSLPRSLEAYRRGDAPLCVSRSHDFKTTANPLLHLSGSYQYARLAAARFPAAGAAPSYEANSHWAPLLRRDHGEAGRALDGSVSPGMTVDDVSALSLLPVRRALAASPWALHGAWFSLHGLSAGAKVGVSAGGVAAGVSGGAGGLAHSVAIMAAAAAAAEVDHSRSLSERVLQYTQACEAATRATGRLLPPPPWCRAAGETNPDAAPCGLNVLDSDMKGGYLLLQLTLTARTTEKTSRDGRDYYWSPRALMEDRLWATLMACFSSRDDRAGREDGDDRAESSLGPSSDGRGGLADAASSLSRSAHAVDGRPMSPTDGAAAGSGPATTRTTAQTSAGAAESPSYIQCDFRASDVFCRLYSGITSDGRTLVLATHANEVTIHNPEELRFSLHPSLLTETAPGAISNATIVGLCGCFTDCDAQLVRHGCTDDAEGGAEVPPDPATDAVVALPSPSDEVFSTTLAGLRGTTTVGYVQLRDRLLFAIKPIDPLRPAWAATPSSVLSAEGGGGAGSGAGGGGDGEWMLPRSAANVTTETVFRRRWIYQHPEVSLEAPHIASWTRLCTCKMLPLYGIKPAYTREGFYTVPPHQYSLTDRSRAAERSKTLEFVLQRLQQQYQIVDHGGLSSQWPRADPSPNMRVDMSIGHQMHTLKIGETTKTISVSRMLHRGMYSNAQVTHMLSYRYSIWNYLSDAFDAREVHMESQVGEKNAYSWEDLDRWIQKRPDTFIPHGPDTWLRAREVAVMLLPDDPSKPPPFEEFHNFIGYRFSVHLSTHGKVEWLADDHPLQTAIPPLTSPEAAEHPEPPALMEVVLTHDNPRALETRNRVDQHTGRTVAFEQPVEERFMLVDIDLHHRYNPNCAYLLKVAWLGCAASIVADWHGSFIANASRYHFRVVPMTCYYQNPRTDTLTVRYDVEVGEQEEATVRRRLLRLLTDKKFRYYPDTAVMNRHCRLIHLTGLCYVVVPPSTTLVAQWYQNALLKQGTPQQQELFRQFCYAVDLAKSDAVID